MEQKAEKLRQEAATREKTKKIFAEHIVTTEHANDGLHNAKVGIIRMKQTIK